MIVSCDCGAKLKVDETKIAGRSVRVRCPRCGNMVPLHPLPGQVVRPVTQTRPESPAPSPTAPLILVAHDSDVVRGMVTDVLSKSGFRVSSAANGILALQMVNDLHPSGLVIDVGLPGIYGFELCERLKNSAETRDIKIILLSSVYDMRRYKRTPVSLYGADDYIEKHHIPDFLAIKLRSLLSFDPGAEKVSSSVKYQAHELPEMSRPPAREFTASLLNPASTPSDFIAAKHPHLHKEIFDDLDEPADSSSVLPDSLSLDASIFQKEEFAIPRVDEKDPDAVEKARRFARIIVSDIALYNQEAVLDGIRQGTFFELLRNDVEEGRELYEKRVPAAIRSGTDYYQEAFDNFIAAAKRKIGQRKNVR